MSKSTNHARRRKEDSATRKAARRDERSALAAPGDSSAAPSDIASSADACVCGRPPFCGIGNCCGHQISGIRLNVQDPFTGQADTIIGMGALCCRCSTPTVLYTTDMNIDEADQHGPFISFQKPPKPASQIILPSIVPPTDINGLGR